MAFTQTLSEPRRIGLMIPSSNTVIEPDFYHNVPDGWTVHTARMYMEDTTVEGESRMLDEFAMPAARDVATARPHVIVFGCTSAGALRGNTYDTDLIARITELTGIPALSVIKAVQNELKNLNALRIVVITPYVDELNERIRTSLTDDGLTILRIAGLGISENFQIGRVPGKEIVDFARRSVIGLQPDALFVSCTNFPAVSVLQELRNLFPFPVISSNQAILNAAITAARAED
ncbi:MAG: Asp/Glu racemase [Chloroflexi bacterium HGW-Chloroflexi-3]|nr:MAG: Asp/Glu racemase [Chloroflexi bacterium HGW-Chloroflexi-3]